MFRKSNKKRVISSRVDNDKTEEGEDDEIEAKKKKGLGFDVEYKSSSSKSIEKNNLDVDTDITKDHQAQFERVQSLLKSDVNIYDGIYRGRAVYGAKVKEDTNKGKASSGYNRIGPMRGNQYMKASVRFDYAPDICKDYKETGFCTFGDSCKFLHDRGDYKHGWEIDRDYEKQQKEGKNDDEYVIKSDEEDEDPTECPICEKEFNSPVITNCKHLFCQACAIANYRKSKKCFTCGEDTNGVFKNAPGPSKTRKE
uniref:Pre-mRNA-splicing factor CWC24 n=1 Tax=Parastrongyloides trichosuri TaxID=131310 RepID=A0A0N4ZF53_PARTI